MKIKLSEVKVKISETLVMWENECAGKYTKEIQLPPYFGYIVFFLVLLAIYTVSGNILMDIPAILGWILFDILGIKMRDKESTKIRIIDPRKFTLAMFDNTEIENKDKINWRNDKRRQEFIELCMRLTIKK